MQSDKLTSALLIGLLTVQTLLLAILLFRINGLHKLLLQARGSLGAPVSEEVLDVEPGDGPSKGAQEAPVTIVEFSCFTCPSCADLQPVLDEVLAAHPGEVRLVFRYFPLALQDKPMVLATAAECARRQGRFWEAHDRLFAHGREIEGEADLLAVLDGLGLDEAAFSECLASDEAASRVRVDSEAGRSYGVSGTPTLFVNGRRVMGADRGTLERVIDASLERG